MTRSIALILVLLSGCEDGNMPPCSALIVIGSVTYNCPGARDAR
jgi:hypothetical protein